MAYRNHLSSNVFNAYTALQLSKSGDIGKGSTFVLPSIGLAELSIGDNDRWLSGDTFRHGRGDDRYGQTGRITEDGDLATRITEGGDRAADEVRVFAERALWVRDQDGNIYRLIEIEVAGHGQGPGSHYYSFDNHFGLPEPGAELTVVHTTNVFFGVKYDRLGVPEKPNQDPVALDDSVETDLLTPVEIDVLGNDSDPDNDQLSITSFQATSAFGGSVVLDGQKLLYTPPAGVTPGIDSFTYEISDGNGGTAEATVNVTLSTPLGSVSGIAFRDLNSNGERDDGEQPIPDVVLWIDSIENGELDDTEQTAVTDANGAYFFGGLEPQEMIVVRAVVPPGLWGTTVNPFVAELSAGENIIADFGYIDFDFF